MLQNYLIDAVANIAIAISMSVTQLMIIITSIHTDNLLLFKNYPLLQYSINQGEQTGQEDSQDLLLFHREL